MLPWRKGVQFFRRTPADIADTTWDRLAEQNARQAWEFWLKHRAPADWLARASATLPPWRRHGLTSAEKWKARYNADPEFRLRELTRVWRRKHVRGRVGEQVRDALRGRGSGARLFEVLGYSVADLKAHLERQFGRGMDWSAFFAGKIHIDHIVPLSQFDTSTLEDFQAAWALSNLRPMWARENIAKGARRDLLC